MGNTTEKETNMSNELTNHIIKHIDGKFADLSKQIEKISNITDENEKSIIKLQVHREEDIKTIGILTTKVTVLDKDNIKLKMIGTVIAVIFTVVTVLLKLIK